MYKYTTMCNGQLYLIYPTVLYFTFVYSTYTAMQTAYLCWYIFTSYANKKCR